MNETDFRSTPLRTLCTSATNSIAELIEFANHLNLMDGVTALEYAEYFYGAVLVACQAYAVGTVADINRIRASNDKGSLEKLTLYRTGSSIDGEHTHIELINSLANYFKHNEEWKSWPINATTKTLLYYGVEESTEFPLRSGIGKIIGESEDLRGLCEVLETWRFGLIERWCR